MPDFSNRNLRFYQPFAFAGQSSVEMAVSISLVALACITYMFISGEGLSDALKGLMGGLERPAVEDIQAIEDVPVPTAGGGGTTTGNSLEKVSMKLANGQYINIDLYPADVRQRIETSGANGATMELVAAIKSIAEQGLANGSLTPEQANALIAMASQGHNIANMEALIEERLAQGRDALSKPITYNGKTYADALDMTFHFGFDPSARDEDVEIAQMRALYATAKRSGALADPAMDQAIGSLMNQIINIANGVESSVYGVTQGYVSPNGFRSQVVQNLTERDQTLGINTQRNLLEMGVATVTHDTATEICKNGTNGNSNTCKKQASPTAN